MSPLPQTAATNILPGAVAQSPTSAADAAGAAGAAAATSPAPGAGYTAPIAAPAVGGTTAATVLGGGAAGALASTQSGVAGNTAGSAAGGGGASSENHAVSNFANGENGVVAAASSNPGASGGATTTSPTSQAQNTPPAAAPPASGSSSTSAAPASSSSTTPPAPASSSGSSSSSSWSSSSSSSSSSSVQSPVEPVADSTFISQATGGASGATTSPTRPTASTSAKTSPTSPSSSDDPPSDDPIPSDSLLIASHTGDATLPPGATNSLGQANGAGGNETNGGAGGLSGGGIAGIVCAVLLALGVGGWWFWQKTKKRDKPVTNDFWNNFFSKSAPTSPTAFNDKFAPDTAYPFSNTYDELGARPGSLYPAALTSSEEKKDKKRKDKKKNKSGDSGDGSDSASSFFCPSRTVAGSEAGTNGPGGVPGSRVPAEYGSPVDGYGGGSPESLSGGSGFGVAPGRNPTSWLGMPVGLQQGAMDGGGFGMDVNDAYGGYPPYPYTAGIGAGVAGVGAGGMMPNDGAGSGLPYANQPGMMGGYGNAPGYDSGYDSGGHEILRDDPPSARPLMTGGAPGATRDSLSSYYPSDEDAPTPISKTKKLKHETAQSAIDSIYSTWGNASSVNGDSSDAESTMTAYSPRSARASTVNTKYFSAHQPKRKSTLKNSWVPGPDDPPVPPVMSFPPMLARQNSDDSMKDGLGFAAPTMPGTGGPGPSRI